MRNMKHGLSIATSTGMPETVFLQLAGWEMDESRGWNLYDWKGPQVRSSSTMTYLSSPLVYKLKCNPTPCLSLEDLEF